MIFENFCDRCVNNNVPRYLSTNFTVLNLVATKFSTVLSTRVYTMVCAGRAPTVPLFNSKFRDFASLILGKYCNTCRVLERRSRGGKALVGTL